MGGDLKLLYVDGSPFARIVRILIGAWQLQVSLQEVDFPLPSDVEALTPMGQVPLLLRAGERPLFPTLNIIEHLARLAPESAEFRYANQDREALVIALSAGDALVSGAYQAWSGLRPVASNALGFETGARNLERFNRTVGWLNDHAEGGRAVDVAIAVFLYWALDRKVAGADTRLIAADRYAALLARPAVAATAPRPHLI